MILTRQDVNDGQLEVPELLGEAIMRSMMQVPRQAQAGALHHDHVEVLSLHPLHAQYHEVRRGYGENAYIVLFFNDAARLACEMYEIEANFAQEIEDRQLPGDLGVLLQIEHYYITAL